MTTLAPSATNRSAVLAPIPLVAPVTTATLPSSAPISCLRPVCMPTHTIRGEARRHNRRGIDRDGSPMIPFTGPEQAWRAGDESGLVRAAGTGGGGAAIGRAADATGGAAAGSRAASGVRRQPGGLPSPRRDEFPAGIPADHPEQRRRRRRRPGRRGCGPALGRQARLAL